MSISSSQKPTEIVRDSEARTEDAPEADASKAPGEAPAKEVGGPAGPEPTRFGDWERKGRCIDF